MALSENIKLMRESRGLSQSELAEKIGLQKQNVSAYERGVILSWNGGKPPTEENLDQLQTFIDNTVVRHMDAYVPMRTGMLKKSVILGSRMGSGELVFIAPYAHKRYYSKSGKLKGKRGSRWFHRMWAACKDTIVREVKNYARRVMP